MESKTLKKLPNPFYYEFLLPDEFRLVQSTELDFKGEKYVYFPNGIAYFELKKLSTYTYKQLSQFKLIAARLLYLNNSIDFDHYVRAMSHISKYHFDATYSNEFIRDCCDFFFDQREKGCLYIKANRNLVFNPNSSFEKGEKKEIEKQVLEAEMSKKIELAINVLTKLESKITQQLIADLIDVSVRTVNRHISKFKEEISISNKKLREKQRNSELKEVCFLLESEGKPTTYQALSNLTKFNNTEIKLFLNHYKKTDI